MIVLSTAKRPWDPWSDPNSIVDSQEYPGLYEGFLHPDLVENGEQEVYFIISLWGKYNTFVLNADLTSLKDNLTQTQGTFLNYPLYLPLDTCFCKSWEKQVKKTAIHTHATI